MNQAERGGTGENGWRLFFVAVLVVGAALRAWLYLATHWSVGDALICFRFGDQFAAGHGLVYNPGQRLSSNTTALYTLLLGLGGSAGISIPLFARVLGIVCDVATLLMMQHLVKTAGCLRSPALRYGLPLAIYLFPLLAMYAVSGMETPLYVALTFFLLVRTLKGQDWLYYLAAALVLFCRPDGVIAIAATGAYLTLQARKIPWRVALLLAAIGLAYALANYLYYGSVFPYSVKLKAFFYHNTRYENFHFIATRFFRRDWVLAVWLVLAAVTAIRLRRTPVVVLLGVTTAALFCYLIFVAPGLRSYYVVSAVYVSSLLVGMGVCSWLETNLAKVFLPATIAGAAAYVAVVVVGGRIVFVELQNARAEEKVTKEDVGLWLKENTPENARVFVTALEVGYYAHRYMLDSPGLATPEVLNAIKANPRLDLFDQANLVKADYLVIPVVDRTRADYRLLQVYACTNKLSEFENMTYGLYQRVSTSDSPTRRTDNQ